MLRAALLLLGVLIVSVPGSVFAQNEEKGKLEGTWIATHWQRGDGVIGKDAVKTELVIGKEGYEFPMGINKISGKGAFKMTEGKNHIDFTPADGPAKGKTLAGIYKLDGDTLILCFRPAGAERPTEFESKDRNTVLAKYRKK